MHDEAGGGQQDAQAVHDYQVEGIVDGPGARPVPRGDQPVSTQPRSHPFQPRLGAPPRDRKKNKQDLGASRAPSADARALLRLDAQVRPRLEEDRRLCGHQDGHPGAFPRISSHVDHPKT